MARDLVCPAADRAIRYITDNHTTSLAGIEIWPISTYGLRAYITSRLNVLHVRDTTSIRETLDYFPIRLTHAPPLNTIYVLRFRAICLPRAHASFVMRETILPIDPRIKCFSDHLSDRGLHFNPFSFFRVQISLSKFLLFFLF